MNYNEIISSNEKNRKKKRYFPEYYINRGYLENQSNILAEKFYSNTLTEKEKTDISISTTWNPDFWIIRGYTIEEANNIISNIQKNNSNKRHEKYTKEEIKKQSIRCLDYWLNKGYTKEESIIKLSNIQSYTLEKYITKYGNKIGEEKYNNRQIKWQNTLNSKTQEEKDKIKQKRNVFNIDNLKRIHGEELADIKYKQYLSQVSLLHTKSKSNGNISKSSIIFFDYLQEKLKSLNIDIFCQYGEFYINRNDINGRYFYDFVIPKLKVIVEYNGIAWHPKENDIDFKTPFKQDYETLYNKDRNKKQLAIDNGFNYYIYWSDTSKTDTEIFLHNLLEDIKILYEKNNNQII